MGVSSCWKFCILCISPKVMYLVLCILLYLMQTVLSDPCGNWLGDKYSVHNPARLPGQWVIMFNFDIHLCELLEWAGICMQLGRVVLSGWHYTLLFCIRLSLEKGLGCTLSYPNWTLSSLKCIFGRWPSLVLSSATGHSKAFFPIVPKVHLGFWYLISLVCGSQYRTT